MQISDTDRSLEWNPASDLAHVYFIHKMVKRITKSSSLRPEVVSAAVLGPNKAALFPYEIQMKWGRAKSGKEKTQFPFAVCCQHKITEEATAWFWFLFFFLSGLGWVPFHGNKVVFLTFVAALAE